MILLTRLRNMKTTVTGLEISKEQWDKLKDSGLLIDIDKEAMTGFVELGKTWGNKLTIMVEMEEGK